MGLRVIVTRRRETEEWLRKFDAFKGFKAIRYLGDLADDLREGDVVAGTLPLHVAARVCAAGAEYWHINFNRSQVSRERLTGDDLDHLVTIRRFGVEDMGRVL